MNKIICLLISIFLTGYCIGQSQKQSILEVNISNPHLKSAVEDFCKRRALGEKDKKGYILLQTVRKRNNNYTSTFSIGVCYDDTTEMNRQDRYPIAYTFTSNGAPVLLYDADLNKNFERRITVVDKQTIQKCIEKFLLPMVNMMGVWHRQPSPIYIDSGNSYYLNLLPDGQVISEEKLSY